MMLNEIALFRKSSQEILDAFTKAYPDGTLNNIAASRSIHEIGGIIVTLKSCLDNRIQEEDLEDLEEEEWEKNNIDYFPVMNTFVSLIERSVSFFKKHEGGISGGIVAAHGQLQRIDGAAQIMIAFLDSIKVDPE